MAKPKAKSYGHETQVAKLFSAWWGAEFKRTPSSGALRWKGVSWTYSDLLPPDDCPVALECKIRKSLDIFMVLRPGNDPNSDHHPISWWNQSAADAQRCYEETGAPIHPLLVFREDRKQNYLALEDELFIALFGSTPDISAFRVVHPAAVSRFTIVDLASFFVHINRGCFLNGTRKVIPGCLIEAVS